MESSELAPNPNESETNLSWLETGARYRCSQGVGGLREGELYQFEEFSSDPLGDTRQYLFRDLSGSDFHAVELSGDMATPLWKDHLSKL